MTWIPDTWDEDEAPVPHVADEPVRAQEDVPAHPVRVMAA